MLGDYGGLWHRYGKFVKFYVLICAFLHTSGLQFTASVTRHVVAITLQYTSTENDYVPSQKSGERSPGHLGSDAYSIVSCN